jgi:hypothetical protein
VVTVVWPDATSVRRRLPRRHDTLIVDFGTTI